VTSPCLVDTNILIDYLRGRSEAVRFLEGVRGRLLISVLTVAELYAGVRDGDEGQRLGAFLEAFEIAPLTPALAEQGGLYRRDYGSSHGTDLVDALLAATAQAAKARLATLNRRHFPMFTRILVPYGEPL